MQNFRALGVLPPDPRTQAPPPIANSWLRACFPLWLYYRDYDSTFQAIIDIIQLTIMI